jgi:hypothetical protein
LNFITNSLYFSLCWSFITRSLTSFTHYIWVCNDQIKWWHFYTCSQQLIKLLITLRWQLQIKKVRVLLKYCCLIWNTIRIAYPFLQRRRHLIDVWIKVHNNVNLLWTLLQIACIILKHKLIDNLTIAATDKEGTCSA